MTDIGRVALAARVFAVAALTTLAALAGAAYLNGAALVLLTAAGALLAAYWVPVSESAVALTEGCVVAVLAVLTHPLQATVTPYLVIPALIAGMDQGRRGLWRVLLAEFGTLVVIWALWVRTWDRLMIASGFTWLATAIGIGLMGVALRRAVSSSDGDSSYRSAVALIRRLDALSEKLSSGLDAVGIAEQVMVEVESEVAIREAAVFVRSRAGEVVPLRFSIGAQPESMAWATEIAERAWQHQSTVLQRHQLALPLTVGDELIAVLALETLTDLDARAVGALARQLGRHAVQLQAALLFGRVRESATNQERQRIAREVHDGVAQDVASFGYLVDNIAGTATDPVQQRQIAQLRTEVTRVVGDLRHSIFDLRNEIPAGSGLGESLSAYAHRVAATSPMAVHVTLDEEGARLPCHVESELLRIGQEAMANARKHSGATNLWLSCRVRSPYAEIEVGDDGTRRHDPAADSQGLAIMRERSSSIGAELDIEAPTTARPGTRVRVRVRGSRR